MTANNIPLDQAIRNASEAMQRGDKRAARYWAQAAASAAPQREEPWLILAAVSRPEASVEYIKQALLANPGSERAMQGLRWAQARLAAQPVKVKAQNSVVTLAKTQPVHPAHPPSAAKSAPRKTSGIRGRVAWFALATLLCVGLAWAAWPARISSALGLIHNESASTLDEGPSWSLAAIVKPTQTAIPTASPSPTSTWPPTSTPLPTDIPTPTPLPTDSPASYPGVQPQPAPAADGKYILVSISEQHLYAYQDNELVYSAVASTGMNNGTRVGVFHVLDKIPNAYGATWNIWMPNWLGIYYSGSLENGIHALPILSNGVRLWAGYLGTPISFGCVVLGIEDAQWIYDWAEVGTPVEIRY